MVIIGFYIGPIGSIYRNERKKISFKIIGPKLKIKCFDEEDKKKQIWGGNFVNPI
jgi:hypothetical protein